MKRAALLLATLVLAAAASAGALAQPQTFWTAKAAPSIPPTPSAPPINPYIYYNVCSGQGAKDRPKSGGTKTGKGNQPCGRRRPTARPSMRPRPRATR